MFNLFRMDCRRLLHSRSFYITAGVTAALLMALTALVAGLSNPAVMDAVQSQGAQVTESDRAMSEEIRGMSQLDFTSECLNSGFLLMTACIGAALFLYSDFQSGYIKNICFARPRRWEYVGSKILLTGVYSGILVAGSVILTILYPRLFGLHPTWSSPLSIALYTFWMWLPHWAFALLGLALVLRTRSSTLSILMGVLGGGGVITAIVRLLCQRFGWHALERYLLSQVVSEQCIPLPGSTQIAMIAACSLGWALLYTASSLLTALNRDI